MTEENPATISEEGKAAYENGQYEQAAEFFQRAAEAFRLAHNALQAAEEKNNQSVALLQAGKPQAALDAALGTEQVFAAAGDLRRQGMALGNQAAALDDLHRPDDALAAYEQADQLFAQAGEGDLRAMVKKSAAAIRLKRGEIAKSATSMIGSLEAKNKPNLFEKLIRSLLRLKP